MANPFCPKTTRDQTNYSAPVPAIGLYIEFATLVCFMFMIRDLINAICRRKPWLPCQHFTLDSITLAFLAIAAKLPVDLTASMPSAYDQLSKLTGTAFLCSSMGFLMPSLGSSKASENITNMIALTIFVVTIVANICIQIYTGVIFSFVKEHYIIIFCMFFWLHLLWSSTLEIHMQKEVQKDSKKDLFKNGKGSMLRRLKLCYLHGYNSEPQFVLCKIPKTMFASFPCLLCVFVVLRVTIRSVISHKIQFCDGHSAYGWTVKIIVLTQIVFILVASLAVGCRWFVNFCDDHDSVLYSKAFDDILFNRPLLKGETRDCFDGYFRYGTEILYTIVTLVLYPINWVLIAILGSGEMIIGSCLCFWCEKTSTQEYEDLLKETDLKMEKWTLKKCVTDINRWMNVNDKSKSRSHLRELLSRITPSQQSLQQLFKRFDFNEVNGVSCLDLVFLVRIASLVSTQSTPSVHLTRSLTEVFDVIHFIDTKMNSLKPGNIKKCMLAKAMWKGEDFSIALANKFKGLMNLPCESHHEFGRAVMILGELKKSLPSLVWDEVGIVMGNINGYIYNGNSKTIGDLFGYIDNLFVYMLHLFLTQLPYAISKELTECPVEEYEEKVRRMLKLQCQIKPLTGKVQWSFGVEWNTSSSREDEEHNIGNANHVEMVQIE